MTLEQRTDFTIRCVRNTHAKKVIIFENKAQEEIQLLIWRRALCHALAYVNLIRREIIQNEEPIYITVAIGTHLRAYTHRNGTTDAENFHMYSGEVLELQRDEEKVHRLFTEMNRITQQ